MILNNRCTGPVNAQQDNFKAELLAAEKKQIKTLKKISSTLDKIERKMK
jgi:hypothetical protein